MAANSTGEAPKVGSPTAKKNDEMKRMEEMLTYLCRERELMRAEIKSLGERIARLEGQSVSNAAIAAAPVAPAVAPVAAPVVAPTAVSEAPPYHMKGNFVRFGEYPQTLKAADVEITQKKDGRGYYLGSDGAYYAKVKADPFVSFADPICFENGAEVKEDEVYYFKVEPVMWQVLAKSDGTALLLCDRVIANGRFASDSNNYATSSVRRWLNGDFYSTAFSKEEKEWIAITHVENGARSTGITDNPNACADTDDKVFLLSGEEIVNTAYGFSYDSTAQDDVRVKRGSDYAVAEGLCVWGSYGGSDWWLRSPDAASSQKALYVDSSGDVSENSMDYNCNGIVPALRIRLQAEKKPADGAEGLFFGDFSTAFAD